MDLIAKYPNIRNIFEEFPECELAAMELLELPAKTILIRKGELAHSMYIILDGVCDVLKDLPNGSTIVNYKLASSDIIGLSELLSFPHQRISTIITCSPVTVIRIPKADFFTYYETYKKFSLYLLNSIIKRLHNALQFSTECTTNSTEVNICYYLCNRYDFYRLSYPETFSGYVKISETRQSMSDYIGLEIRSINRYLSIFKADGTITVIKGKIHINYRQYQELLKKI